VRLCNSAIDLIQKLIELDPSRRLTAEQTLAHPYLEDYHDPDDEPTCEAQPTSHQFAAVDSANDLDISRWKGITDHHV